MSRKTILIIVAVILVALGVWVYVSYKSAPASLDETSPDSLGSLFPFGNSGNVPPGGENTGGGTDGGSGSTPGASGPSGRLVQVTNKFTAGFTALPASTQSAAVDINDDSGTAGTVSSLPIVRFAERGTGYIYDVDAKGQNLKKSSGTVIAHTLLAHFGDSGNTVIIRYLENDNKTIATYLGHIVPPADARSFGTTIGSFLSKNITDLVLSRDRKNMLFLLPSANGSAALTMKTDGSGQKQIFSSTFSEWLLDWPATGAIVTTKASANVPGYAYAITSAGNLDKILGKVNGLTTKMSPDGKSILYSVTDTAGHIDLKIRNLKDGKDITIGLSTLPEKCTWNSAGTLIYCGAGTTVPVGEYPDSWYQGITHFDDALWKIDAKTGITTELNTGEGKYLDVTYASLDEQEQYLFFINKNDASLWSFDLKTPAVVPETPALPNVN